METEVVGTLIGAAITLLLWLLRKVSAIESKLAVLEERINWIARFLDENREE